MNPEQVLEAIQRKKEELVADRALFLREKAEWTNRSESLVQRESELNKREFAVAAKEAELNRAEIALNTLREDAVAKLANERNLFDAEVAAHNVEVRAEGLVFDAEDKALLLREESMKTREDNLDKREANHQVELIRLLDAIKVSKELRDEAERERVRVEDAKIALSSKEQELWIKDQDVIQRESVLQSRKTFLQTWENILVKRESEWHAIVTNQETKDAIAELKVALGKVEVK